MIWGASPAQLNTGEVRNGEEMREGGTGADFSSGKERLEGIVDWKICKTREKTI